MMEACPPLRPSMPTSCSGRPPPEERAGRPLLVLLHGYGADEHDLFGLVPYLPPEFVVAAVRAPLPPPWPAPGYSWYPIEGLETRDRGARDGVGGAAHRVARCRRPTRPGGLLGFSQGAAVAIQAMRLDPGRFAFLVNLSGYADPGRAPRRSRCSPSAARPSFWGRGTHDDVIPEALVEHTIQWLPGHVDLSGRVYQGLTHSVSEEELADVRVFLEKQLGELRLSPAADGARSVAADLPRATDRPGEDVSPGRRIR